MTSIASLWLPIVLSAVFVFLASSIIHMALPWHNSDFRSVPNEDQVVAALRPLAIPPGDYALPKPTSMKELRTPAYLDRLTRGPVLTMTVMPNGMMKMGGMLFQWFLYLLVVAALAGIVAGTTLPRGADFHVVVHTVAITAFLGYTMALWQMSIWYRRSLSTTLKSTVDGLIYAAITAATFAWLWPR
jgi:hypothetical protein